MAKTQTYISSELTHFVGRSLSSDEERYNLLVKIIKTGIIRTKHFSKRGQHRLQRFPRNKISTNETFNLDMVCFCDIPVSDFEIHMKKYSYFGLSFNKEFMVSQGMRPVYYIPRRTFDRREYISDIFNSKYLEINDCKEIPTFIRSFLDFEIFSFIKFFDSEKEDDDPDNYYMEREWRGLDCIEFNVQDISRIILPSTFIKRFFQDVPDYNAHVSTT